MSGTAGGPMIDAREEKPVVARDKARPSASAVCKCEAGSMFDAKAVAGVASERDVHNSNSLVLFAATSQRTSSLLTTAIVCCVMLALACGLRVYSAMAAAISL